MSGLAAGASTTAPAARLRTLVAASTKIDRLTSALQSELTNQSSLWTRNVYPSVGVKCVSVCTFGDPHSNKTIVIFGDSHALMWLPAVIAAEPLYKIELLWAPTCPLAAVPRIKFTASTVTTDCAGFRASSITAIKSIDPKLVILGERTYGASANGRPISNATWARALEATMRQVRSKTTHVALMQDVIAFTGNPLACVAASPSSIQRACSVSNPNSKAPGHQAAEKTAATTGKVTLVVTIPWFCARRCSPAVGDYLVHYDQGHISVPYAKFLAGVLGASLKPLLK